MSQNHEGQMTTSPRPPEQNSSRKLMDLLKFVLTNTYFILLGMIYKRKFGAAMGSPASPVTANIFME